MADEKKHDLREGIPKATITNTESRMAGGLDNPNVKVKDGSGAVLRPGATDHVPDGQDTKSS